MAKVKLQYSIICEQIKGSGFLNVIHGFKRGQIKRFYVANKWVWDDTEDAEDGFFQVTEIVRNNVVIAFSRSKIFEIKLGHSHHNLFKNIYFKEEADYRIRINLYDKEGNFVKEGSLEYPVYVRGDN